MCVRVSTLNQQKVHAQGLQIWEREHK